MYSTFAALSGLAFFFGLRTTGFAIVELPFRGARAACEVGPGWSVRIIRRCWCGSEGRVVVRRAATTAGGAAEAAAALAAGRAGGPRVVDLLAAALVAATPAAAGAGARPAAVAAGPAPEAAATAALSLGDLGGRAPQARADLVDLHLEHGALLALLGLEAAGLQPALGDHGGAPGEGLGDVLGSLTPDRAAHEQRLAVLPLVRLTVERARRRGDREVRDRGAGRRETQLGVIRDVADDRDDRVACHGPALSVCGNGGGCRGAGIGERSADLGPQQLGAQHGLVQPQLTVQLLRDRGLGGHVDHGVDALGLLVDVVRQAAPTPDIDLLHRAAALADDVEELVEARRDGALLEIGVEDHHELVVTLAGTHLLWTQAATVSP